MNKENYFSQGLHCSQSVLASFADECGITEEHAIKLCSCFGTGMRKGEVCGAVTGALMVLGLLYGQNKAGDAEGRQRANKVDDLMMNCPNVKECMCPKETCPNHGKCCDCVKNHVSAWSGGEASDRRERSERGRRGLPSTVIKQSCNTMHR